MPRIDPNSVLWKEVDGVVVVLLVARSYFIELNKVGSAIWKLLAKGNTPEQIVDNMQQSYHVSREELAADVKEFIAKMVEQGMVHAA